MASADDGSAASPLRVTLRPIGTPVALGLGAILFGTTMLSALQLGWVGGEVEQRTVGFVAVAAAFPLEFLAAILAFLARDALAGTGLGVFSSMWAVGGLALLTGEPNTPNDALGVFFLLGALALLLLLLSAGKGRVVLGLLIVAGCVRLLLTGLAEITGTGGMEVAAGAAGLVLAAVCVYGIVAILQEDLPQPARVPVGRSGAAGSAMAGSLHDQVGELQNEAGVRRLL